MCARNDRESFDNMKPNLRYYWGKATKLSFNNDNTDVIQIDVDFL